MSISPSPRTVTILGSNGHLGHAATRAFAAAGWSVTALARANRKPVAGTTFVTGDASDVETVRRAVADAAVVTNGLHLRYDQWGKGRVEAQLQVVLDAMAGTGKTLIFPGTIYNYRASDRTIAPGLRQDGERPRGAIRIRLETMLAQAAQRNGFQVIILRAGDFYGGRMLDDWYGQAMLMHMARNRLYHLGPLALRHSWAYLPDLGRALVTLAENRQSLAGVENFHFAGHWVSHGQIMAAIEASLGRHLAIRPFPWWMLKAAGLVNPVMRELERMRYLWTNEMELVDPRLDRLLGPGATTPFETAVATSVADIMAARAG